MQRIGEVAVRHLPGAAGSVIAEMLAGVIEGLGPVACCFARRGSHTVRSASQSEELACTAGPRQYDRLSGARLLRTLSWIRCCNLREPVPLLCLSFQDY